MFFLFNWGWFLASPKPWTFSGVLFLPPTTSRGPVKKPWFHRVNNCVLLENGHPTFNRESLFHGYFYENSLRNWVDEFIPYYMGTPAYIVNNHDSILLAVAAVSGGSSTPPQGATVQHRSWTCDGRIVERKYHEFQLLRCWNRKHYCVQPWDSWGF